MIGAGSANWQFASLPNHNHSDELRRMDDWRNWQSLRVKKWRKLPVCATRSDHLSENNCCKEKLPRLGLWQGFNIPTLSPKSEGKAACLCSPLTTVTRIYKSREIVNAASAV